MCQYRWHPFLPPKLFFQREPLFPARTLSRCEALFPPRLFAHLGWFRPPQLIRRRPRGVNTSLVFPNDLCHYVLPTREARLKVFIHSRRTGLYVVMPISFALRAPVKADLSAGHLLGFPKLGTQSCIKLRRQIFQPDGKRPLNYFRVELRVINKGYEFLVVVPRPLLHWHRIINPRFSVAPVF